MTFIVAILNPVLKLFTHSLFPHSRLSLPQPDLLELWPVVVWQLLAAVVLVSAHCDGHSYLLTYLLLTYVSDQI